MKNRDGLENNNDWETPDWLYKKLDDEFHFDFDPCPLKARFDGLAIEWGNRNYINPPYSRTEKVCKPNCGKKTCKERGYHNATHKAGKEDFIQKAYEEWRKGKTCVLLIPAATGTKQFHDIMLPNAEIRFLRGRVSFKGYNSKGVYSTKNKGKHDSMVVIFRGER